MKNTFKFFVTLFLLAVVLNTSKAQVAPEFWPTFTMTAKNITTNPTGPPGPNQTDNQYIFWDVYILQTNYGQAGNSAVRILLRTVQLVFQQKHFPESINW
jgi:hypothetical protein